ncbi:class F sortase [Xylanimonas protaetiae]|uniref:Class F sortase n=1 Tax=Xylanimonas protaetiae TaxID=2509457 RepID=A0A4V0YG33_9MICO|nr:class F sortase [Xylanimonas protaetiae]QAY69811.1 class F sortase [Xylanimonas protaetiae]
MRRVLRLVLVAVLALSLAGAGLTLWEQHLRPDAATTLRDLDGRRVELDLPPDLEAAAVEPTGGRFVAPDHGLDVPLVWMSVDGSVLNPPTLTDAFVVRDPAPAADGAGGRPRIVAMHAVRGGRAPGNAFAASSGEVLAAPGDRLYVDGDLYVVDTVEVVPKEAAERDASIWGVRDDGDVRLVVLTCLQRPGGPTRAPDNLVLHASRA